MKAGFRMYLQPIKEFPASFVKLNGLSYLIPQNDNKIFSV